MMFVKMREYQRGQTMAEYALILAAVAIVCFAGYKVMGTTITAMLSSVDSSLQSQRVETQGGGRTNHPPPPHQS